MQKNLMVFLMVVAVGFGWPVIAPQTADARIKSCNPRPFPIRCRRGMTRAKKYITRRGRKCWIYYCKRPSRCPKPTRVGGRSCLLGRMVKKYYLYKGLRCFNYVCRRFRCPKPTRVGGRSCLLGRMVKKYYRYKRLRCFNYVCRRFRCPKQRPLVCRPPRRLKKQGYAYRPLGISRPLRCWRYICK